MLLSFMPICIKKDQRKNLLFISMNMLWIHSAYSAYKFYYPLTKLYKENTVKKVSVALGVAGQIVLSLGKKVVVKEVHCDCIIITKKTFCN